MSGIAKEIAALTARAEKAEAERDTLREALTAVLEDGDYEPAGEFGIWAPSDRALKQAREALSAYQQHAEPKE